MAAKPPTVTTETHLVELTCRHYALLTLPLYSDWLHRQVMCEVCGQVRTVVKIADA